MIRQISIIFFILSFALAARSRWAWETGGNDDGIISVTKGPAAVLG